MSDQTEDLTEDETKEPIPEADALEQAEPVADERAGEPSDRRSIPLPKEVPDDVPEADALEQSTDVPGQDEDDAPR
jgi:hypothetical protein